VPFGPRRVGPAASAGGCAHRLWVSGDVQELGGVFSDAGVRRRLPLRQGQRPARPSVTITSLVGVKISGGFGTTPSVTVPATAAPSALTQQVLSQGSGATVAKDDTVIDNYVGQTWMPPAGKVNVFDSSFSRGSPAAFLLGEGQVIPGWDTALVGKQLGSRVLLTIPPADGYGSAGQPGANISGTDTLVFVIDLVAAYTRRVRARDRGT
jgi:peptidylprolyl isomerase